MRNAELEETQAGIKIAGRNLHARVPGHVQQGQRVVDGPVGGLLRQQGEEVQGCPPRLHSLQGRSVVSDS